MAFGDDGSVGEVCYYAQCEVPLAHFAQRRAWRPEGTYYFKPVKVLDITGLLVLTGYFTLSLPLTATLALTSTFAVIPTFAGTLAMTGTFTAAAKFGPMAATVNFVSTFEMVNSDLASGRGR